jgi:hypothetical protein
MLRPLGWTPAGLLVLLLLNGWNPNKDFFGVEAHNQDTYKFLGPTAFTKFGYGWESPVIT